MEYWRKYRNKNRGYQKLRVWEDAIEFYVKNSKVFKKLPYNLSRIASQAIASSDSVHRNIAEGYCRKSIKEYLQFLNIALSSLGESVSGLIACKEANQITQENFDILNASAFKLENRLLKLIESLEHKRNNKDWTDSLVVKESNSSYAVKEKQDGDRYEYRDPLHHYSNTPKKQSSELTNSITPN